MINYKLAGSTWDDKELSAISEVIESDMFSMGKFVENFEKQFAEYFGSKFAVMVNSGSSANLIMTAALFYTNNINLRLQRGDEIIVPAVSWSTTYFPLCQYGLKLKFIDVDADTLNFNLEQLQNEISDKTRAILAVNLLGNPNDYSRIVQMTTGRNIVLLEDNCESMGATFDGKFAGTFGVMGTYSSFFSHHISTMEGGCVVTDDEELYHILLCLRAHGWTRNLPDKNYVSGTKSRDSFDESFKFVLPGYNVRPIEMSGAIGSEQLKKLPMLLRGRRDNASYFVERFSKHPFLDIQIEMGESSWFGFSLVVKKGSDVPRKYLIEKLTNAGIECRPIVTGNFAKNDVLQYFDFEICDSLSNAEHIDKCGFFVGNHHFSLRKEIDALYKALS